MAAVSGWSWPVPFVVPPCTQSADFAQPPQGAGIFRDRTTASWPTFPDRCRRESQELDFTPIALGGYRPWGSQVIEKGLPDMAQREDRLAPERPPKGPAASHLDTQIR